jgi:hypothetical protein
MDLGDTAADLRRGGKRAQRGTLPHVRDRGHAAPTVQLTQGPDREFLQAEDIRTIRACESHHLLEECLPSGRHGVPVEEVPGPDKQALYCTAHMRLRRARFADVIERQLDLFEREHRGLIDDCVAAERAYDRAPRDEAEERYGDYVDLVETGTELLADLRDNFASTVEDEVAEEYEQAFNQAVLRRFRRFALEIEDR